MYKSELIEGTTPASTVADALFRQGLRTTTTTPAEAVWRRIVEQIQTVESPQRKGGFKAEAIPSIPFGMGATYLLGMPAKSGV